MNQKVMAQIELSKLKFKQGLRSPNDGIVATSNPFVFCSKLPHHWRSNKSLPSLFQVILCCENNIPIQSKDGCRVWLTANNQFIGNAVLRNSESRLMNGEALFNDLRFVSRSGRGKYFDLFIHIDGESTIVAGYPSAIKVTVDGPREPRNKHKVANLSKNPFSLVRYGNTMDSSGFYPALTVSTICPNEQNPAKTDPGADEKPVPIFPLLYMSGMHPQLSNLNIPPHMNQDYSTFIRLMMMASVYKLNYPMLVSRDQDMSKSKKPEIINPKIWRPF